MYTRSTGYVVLTESDSAMRKSWFRIASVPDEASEKKREPPSQYGWRLAEI